MSKLFYILYLNSVILVDHQSFQAFSNKHELFGNTHNWLFPIVSCFNHNNAILFIRAKFCIPFTVSHVINLYSCISNISKIFRKTIFKWIILQAGQIYCYFWIIPIFAYILALKHSSWVRILCDVYIDNQ